MHLQGFLNHAVCRCRREVSENVRRIVVGKIVIENARGFRAIYDKIVRGASARARFREVGFDTARWSCFAKLPTKNAARRKIGRHKPKK